MLSDKGCDANAGVALVRDSGTVPVMLSRSNQLAQRNSDRHLNKNRNLLERFFYRIKPFRRIAICYERLSRNFNAMLLTGYSFIWIFS